MKLIHIADLHLGKQMNDLSLQKDQAHILDQIVSIASAEQADAVLIAGDVYQRSSPQAEAMALFDGFVSRLAALGINVFIISGNHDSALRISYFSQLVRSAGVYASDAFEGHLQHVTLQDDAGDVVFWLMPYLRASQVRRWLPEEKISSVQDAVTAVIRQADIDPAKRNVLLCHQFITGCETAGSEEQSVGGLDAISAEVFDAFDYVALGHIHRAQRAGRDTVRYSGSPLKYSFSEADHTKSLTLVDMPAKGSIQVHTIPLTPLHDVRMAEGMLEELLNAPYSEDYVWVTIHDELPPPDAKVSLTVNFPNMLKFSVVNSRTKFDVDVQNLGSLENKSVAALFSDFYRLQNNDQLPGEKHMKVLDKIIKELEEAPYEAR